MGLMNTYKGLPLGTSEGRKTEMLPQALLLAIVLSLSLTVKAATAGPWQQCGGITYKGPIECDPGWVCTYLNDCKYKKFLLKRLRLFNWDRF